MRTTYLIPTHDEGDPMTKTGTLPAFPHEGMFIDVDGNYREVHEVYFKSGRLEVWFYSTSEDTVENLEKLGWKS